MSNVTAEVRIRPSQTGIVDYADTTITAGSKTYTFTKIHASTTQRALFEGSVTPVLDHFFEGYDCAVLAYGQTGSGKTYTMGISHNSTGAIIQRSLERIFSINLPVKISFIEIYNEEIIDLLGEARVPLNIRQTGESLTIVGLKEYTVSNHHEALELLNRGCLERTTKATKMNSASSRSHAIFTVVLQQQRGSAIIESQMAFVDLAGSERLKRTECRGSAARESISINSGLLSLGNVINALYLNKKHVPYRDSKLTRILARCLGSNLLLLACISPEAADTSETVNTLKYASRAALISKEERVHVSKDKDKLAIDQLKREISKLKDENMRLRGMLHSKNHEKIEMIKKHPYVQDLLKKVEQLTKRGIRNKEVLPERTEGLRGNMANNTFIKGITEQSEDKKGVSMGLKFNKIEKCGSAVNELKDINGKKYGRCCDGVAGNDSIKQKNTIYNKNIQPEEVEYKGMDRRDRKVFFDLEQKIVTPPIAKQQNTTKALFTPKKEKLSVFSTFQKTINHSPLVMAAFNEGVVASCSDGVVRELGDREVQLFTDMPIRCLAVASNSDFNLGNAVIYSCRSLLKAYDGSSRPLPVYAYKSEISALRIFNNFIFTGHEDGSLSVLDIRSSSLVFSSQIHRSTIFDIENIDGNLFTCSRDHNIICNRTEDVINGTCQAESGQCLSPPHYDTVTRLLNYNSALVSLSRDCSIKVWKGTQPYKTVPYAHDNWIRAGTVLPNFWITGCKAGVVRCWDFLDSSVRCTGKIDVKSPIVSLAACNDLIWVGCQKDVHLYKTTHKTI